MDSSLYIPLSPGTVLQRGYEILGVIGSGGMGAVYKAKHLELGNEVAIKETHRTDLAFREAFLREAKLLAGLKHNALPKVHDFFSERLDFESTGSDRLGNFLVMEYISGNNLTESLRLHSAYHLEPVMVWADQILSALSYLHTLPAPIVHKDVKPSNLKVGDDNQVILLDFGLSKTMDDGTFVYGNSRHYSSLEQCNNVQTDARSDLYSLAATVYHLLTGVPPPDAVDRDRAVSQHRIDPLDESLTRYGSLISPLIADELRKAMALSRESRHTNAEEMRTALKNAWINQTTNISPSEVPTLPFNREGLTEPPRPDTDEATVLPPLLTVFKRRLAGHQDDVSCVTFSPAEDLLASGCENGDLGVWNISSGKLRKAANSTKMSVTDLVFSPDGRTIACSRLNNTVELWDVPSLELKWRFRTQGLEAHALAFRPDGKGIAAGELSKPPTKITLWDLTTLQLKSSFEGEGHFLVKALCFSPDGKKLASALWSRNTEKTPDRQGQIRIWDPTTSLSTVLIDNSRANALAFSPSGDLLACGCIDKTVRLIEVKTGSARRTLAGHRNSISSLAFCPDGETLASCDFTESANAAGEVRLWNVSNGLLLKQFESQPGGVRALTFSANGKHLAFTAKSTVSLYEIEAR